jgi:hypothetical protein
MSWRDDVIRIARQEADNKVCWRTHGSRILEYFKTSTGRDWSKAEALKLSWCTYFVHWVLVQAKVEPKVVVGVPNGLSCVGGSVGRFMKKYGGAFDIQPATASSIPRPGDLYNQPKSNNHLGIIVGVEAGRIYTADGNSGPPDGTTVHDPDSRFGDYQLLNWKPIIGGGMVFRPPTPKRLGADDFYILLPGP